MDTNPKPNASDYTEVSHARSIPTELADAKLASSEAWNEYMQMIARDHTTAEFFAALNKTRQADDLVSHWYDRWQAVGGTSAITSIVDAEIAAEQRKALQVVIDVAGASIIDGVSSQAWWDTQEEVKF